MKRIFLSLFFLIVLFPSFAVSAEFRVDAARSDITLTKRVPLWGQFDMRLSQGMETP